MLPSHAARICSTREQHTPLIGQICSSVQLNSMPVGSYACALQHVLPRFQQPRCHSGICHRQPTSKSWRGGVQGCRLADRSHCMHQTDSHRADIGHRGWPLLWKKAHVGALQRPADACACAVCVAVATSTEKVGAEPAPDAGLAGVKQDPAEPYACACACLAVVASSTR